MAITSRTLALAMGVSDLTVTLDSTVTTLAGSTILIGTEYMTQAGLAVGVVVPVRRGQSGSAQLAHSISAGVQIGLAEDFLTNPIQASVFTDSTLTGNGSSADPLSVVGGGNTILGVLTSDPSSPDDDTAWIVRTGTSPGDAVSLKVRVNGVTYELAGVTIQ